jgi:hypothetical protein
MTLVEQAMEILKVKDPVELASAAVHFGGEQDFVIKYLVDAMRSGSMPGLVRSYCASIVAAHEKQLQCTALKEAA